MTNVVLEAKKRDTVKNKKKLLGKFILPAVVYWKKIDSLPIELDYQTFRKTLIKVGQWQIITLSLEWKEHKVLIKSYDLDLVKNTFTHVDFLAVDMDKDVVAKIPIELYWESEAVRLWAILSQNIDAIEIKCKPTELPVSFKVDIVKLVDPSDHIYVSDLEWIDKVEPQIDEWMIVAWVIIPRSLSAAELAAEDAEEAWEAWVAWEGEPWEAWAENEKKEW